MLTSGKIGRGGRPFPRDCLITSGKPAKIVVSALLPYPRKRMNCGLPLKLRRCLPWLFCVLLSGNRMALAADPPSGEGEPFMQYFSSRDYQGEAQCWCFAQDGRRVMYVGNVGAVLEYDGTSWRRVSIRQSELVTALAYDPAQDAVFVGVRGDVGYLKLLPDGAREYVSLLSQLPPGLRDVGYVSDVYPVPGGIFFVGATQVMRWRDGQFKVWPLEIDGKLTSAWVDGHLYVHNPRTGLLRLEGDTFVPASDDPLFRHASVRAMLPLADGTLLIGTRHEEAYILLSRKRSCSAYCAKYCDCVGSR